MKHIKTQLKTKHKTREGIISKISDLTTSHLHNIIKFWTWRAHRGVTIKYPAMDDGKGNYCHHSSECYLDGVAVLREISLLSYIIEYNKRDNCFSDYSNICKTVGGSGTITDDREYWEDYADPNNY